MCDLLGISCNENDRASRSLKEFGEKFSDTNPDGWGIGFWKDGKADIIHASKNDLKAKKSKLFRETRKVASSKNFIAHVRTQSCGKRDEHNCHPFSFHDDEGIIARDWIFAHNGTVREFDPHPRAKGGTDSESIFNEIMDYMKEYLRRGKIHGIYPALLKAIGKIFKKYGKRITLNLLMSDGNMYYAFSHYAPDKICKECSAVNWDENERCVQCNNNTFKDHNHHWRENKPIFMKRRGKAYGNVILLSTGKFDTPGYADDRNWEKIPRDQLLVVNCGEIIVCSDPI